MYACNDSVGEGAAGGRLRGKVADSASMPQPCGTVQGRCLFSYTVQYYLILLFRSVQSHECEQMCRMLHVSVECPSPRALGRPRAVSCVAAPAANLALQPRTSRGLDRSLAVALRLVRLDSTECPAIS